MQLVSSSSIKASTTSPTDKSLSLPTEIKWEKPNPLLAARENSEPIMEPLCDTKAILPTHNCSLSKAAFTEMIEPWCRFATPMLFGPNNRIPKARAFSTNRSWAFTPSGPDSAKPSEYTVTSLAPAAAHCSSIPSTWRPGIIMKT